MYGGPYNFTNFINRLYESSRIFKDTSLDRGCCDNEVGWGDGYHGTKHFSGRGMRFGRRNGW